MTSFDPKRLSDQEIFELNLYQHYGIELDEEGLVFASTVFPQYIGTVAIMKAAEQLSEDDQEKLGAIAERYPDRIPAFLAVRGIDSDSISLGIAIEAKRRLLMRYRGFASCDDLHKALKHALPSNASFASFNKFQEALGEIQTFLLDVVGFDEERAEQAKDKMGDTAWGMAINDIADIYGAETANALEQAFNQEGDEAVALSWSMGIDIMEMCAACANRCLDELQGKVGSADGLGGGLSVQA